MKIKYTKNAAANIEYWKKKDPAKVKRIKKLLENIQVNPFAGIGKPEPLKHGLSGNWSRRIGGEHRLIYTVQNDSVIVLQCRYHY